MVTYVHTKVGTKLFNLTKHWTWIMLRNKWLYYLLSVTWGLLATLFGAIVSLIFIKNKPKKFHMVWYQEIGPDYWGGFSLGLFTFKDKKEGTKGITDHEMGHSFQNTLFGPFFFFLVAIPSFIRYWYQTSRSKKGLPNKPYDQVWFEDSATQCGNLAVEYLEGKYEKNKKTE